jgi:hypothetical protein
MKIETEIPETKKEIIPIKPTVEPMIEDPSFK